MSIPEVGHLEAALADKPFSNSQAEPKPPEQNNDHGQIPRKRKQKLTFSTPNVREEKPTRRSKRLSDERDQHGGSPSAKVTRKDQVRALPPPAVEQLDKSSQLEQTPAAGPVQENGDGHSATKIALPFADTPVIRRNRAMREGKSGKGERRSSLGLRGRRASSLIDAGTSNGESWVRPRSPKELPAMLRSLPLTKLQHCLTPKLRSQISTSTSRARDYRNRGE